MYRIFEKLSSSHQVEYLTINGKFTIVGTSLGINRFSESSDPVISGKDVRDYFPELIGYEDTLTEIIQKKQDILELSGIAKFGDDNPLFIDISVCKYPGLENGDPFLIIVFEDVSEKMFSKQRLTQDMNEKALKLAEARNKSFFLQRKISPV
jgi:hypothetical protein